MTGTVLLALAAGLPAVAAGIILLVSGTARRADCADEAAGALVGFGAAAAAIGLALIAAGLATGHAEAAP